MLKFVRLPLINMKQLVTDIKFSGFFDDQSIFEALQFQVAQEVIENQNSAKFVHRGIRTTFDHKHFDLGIREILTPGKLGGILGNQIQEYISLQRDKVCQSTDDSTISAITGEPLPLHGIHYWEIKLKTENPANLKRVQIGLCHISDNQHLEDSFKSKSAILLNCFDSSFWSNGQ